MEGHVAAAAGSIKIKQGTAEHEFKAVVFDIGGTLIGHHDYVNFTNTDNPIRVMKPGAFRLLRLLAFKKRVKLAIASNTRIEAEEVMMAFKRMGFTEEHFVIIALSSDLTIGKGKPSGVIYEVVKYALHKVGIKPRETLFVGDHYRNDAIKPKKRGMKTLYLAGEERDEDMAIVAQKRGYKSATFKVDRIEQVADGWQESRDMVDLM